MFNKIRTLAIAFTVVSALIPAISNATIINFVSGDNDVCKIASDSDGKFNDDCALSAEDYSTWIDADVFNTAAGSTGATWIQAEGSYIRSNLNDYRIFEFDLNKLGEDMFITSLFLSVDDDASIKSGGNVIWDSVGISQPWTTVIDVIALLGAPIDLAGNNRLNFYVHDIGSATQGPTGIIFAGTATSVPGLSLRPASVPEPSLIALFGLGLVGLGFARRRKHS